MRSVDPENRDSLRDCGARVAEIRRKHGLSQFDMSELTGLHVNTIANLERGVVDPSVLAASLVFVFLGCHGVLVEKSCFDPMESSAPPLQVAFPSLIRTQPNIARMMGSCVQNWRRNRELSLDEVARGAGVHRNTIWNFEQGLVAPALTTTHRIYRALEIHRVDSDASGILFL